MTEGQARVYIKQFVADLNGFPIETIHKACEIYRQDSDNKIMARSADILKICREIRGDQPKRLDVHRASKDAHQAASQLEQEMKRWMEQKPKNPLPQPDRENWENVVPLFRPPPKGPSETIKEIKAGFPGTRDYEPSPDDCIAKAKALVEKMKTKT